MAKSTCRIISKATSELLINPNDCLHLSINRYKFSAGDYCESVIPDPIPNSEVKPFSADGTLS